MQFKVDTTYGFLDIKVNVKKKVRLKTNRLTQMDIIKT